MGRLATRFATKQEKPSTVLTVVSCSLPPSSIPSRPSSFSLCLHPCYLSSSHFRGASRGISALLFRLLLFAAFTPTPVCLPLAAAISFFVRFSLFVGAPTAFDSFWAELAWPLARAQTRAHFNPLGCELHPRSVGWTWVIVCFLSADYSYFTYF